MKRIYLITGASSDLGISYIKSLDAKLQNQECVIYGTYNTNSSELDELSKKASNVHIIPIFCDLGDDESVCQLIEKLKSENHVPTHMLHLAASKFEYMRIKNFDWNKVKHELDIQVGAFGNICKWILPDMAKRKLGKIVVILSAYTLGVPPKFMSDYIITKYALLGFVKAVASEYAGKGITINALSPNMMETKFLSNLDARVVEMNATNSIMKRNIELQEVIHGIEFLMDDNASYINGINLNLSGGERM